MLILSRRIGEKIIIGDDTEVTILGIKGNQVRLGVNAPQQVSVHREEIHRKIEKEKLANACNIIHKRPRTASLVANG